MGSMLTSHLRTSYDAAVQECVADLRKRPELTAGTMRVRTRSKGVSWPTVSSEMVSATDRDVLVNHTSEVVSALCFDHLVSAPHSAYGRHVRGEHANEVAVLTEYAALRVVSLATRNLCLCLACQKIAHPFLRSTSPSARAIANRAFPASTLSFGTCTSDETSVWCDHPNACFGSLGRKYLVGSIEATRLLHNFLLTSHLRAMYDAAVKNVSK